MKKADQKQATPKAPKAKKDPALKAQRKAAKAAARASDTMTDVRTEKKAVQKKSLKSAAKQLQKELDNRMAEVVKRIRKETKAKLKEVVKDATRRLDVDTERMFEQALHTIVRQYDNATPAASDSVSTDTAAGNASSATTSGTAGKAGQSARKRPSRARSASPRPQPAVASRAPVVAKAPVSQSRKPSTSTPVRPPAASEARRSHKRAAPPTKATDFQANLDGASAGETV